MISYHNTYNSTWSTSNFQTTTGTEHTPTSINYNYEVTSTVYVTPVDRIKRSMTYKTYIEEQKLAKQEVLEFFPVVFKEPKTLKTQNKSVDSKNRYLSKLGKGLHSYQ